MLREGDLGCPGANVRLLDGAFRWRLGTMGRSIGQDHRWSGAWAVSTIVAMESRLSFRLRIMLGLMPMFGLTAMSCTINPDADPSDPEIAVEENEGADTAGTGVRSSDGTSPDSGTAGSQGTAGTQGGGGDEGTGGSSSTGVNSQSDSGGETGDGSQAGSDGTGTGTALTDSSSGTECAKVEASFTPVIPSIYLLVDRSGSMNSDLPGAGTRWEAVKTTLVEEGDPADPSKGGVVFRMQEQAKFALATYTSSSSTCPVMHYSETGTANELPKLNNWAGVKDRLDQAGPGGRTPSSEAIAWVWNKMKANDDPNRILVFASDGDPYYYDPDQCVSFPYPTGFVRANGNRARVVDVVEAMHADNIKTFVIGVGNGASDTHLDDVARAGVGVTSGMTEGSPGYPENPNEGGTDNQNYFFAGTDSEKLQKAFERIIVGARPCKFQLEGELTAVGASGEVKINGELKPYNDPNGWRVNSSTEIELLGDSCKQIRSDANVDLKVSFSCEVFQPG